MMRKILPTLIGVVLAGGMSVAGADVTLFGHIDTSIDSTDQDGGSDDINLNCTTCSVGFKGAEDLGNGLKAIFQVDFGFNSVETGNNGENDTITDRDQWLGLSGNAFGKVRIGTISTGYKSHGALIDPLYRTALQGRDRGLQSGLHSSSGEELEGRATNTIRWDSIDYNGVRLVAHYTLDSDETTEDEDPYGVGASYENAGLLVFADYMNNNQDDEDMTAGWKVGGKYDMGLFSVMGQYEEFDDSTDPSLVPGSSWNDDVTLWHIAGGVNRLLGMNIYVGFGQGDNDDNNQGYTAWTLAVSHDFSKSTMIYTGFNQVDCDDMTNPGATLDACSGVDPTGGEDEQFSVGMKHKF
jgi:predicted porin